MKTITVHYGIAGRTAEVDCDYTVDDLTSDPSFKLALGWGDNVTVSQNGVRLNGGHELADGGTFRVDTACNEKAQDTKMVEAGYGIATVKLPVPYAMTFGELKASREFKAGLGFGDNVICSVGGVPQRNEAVIPCDAVVRIEPRCNEKAEG